MVDFILFRHLGSHSSVTCISSRTAIEPYNGRKALFRIYRMGHQKGVTMIKYRMRNSFEEKVITIQDRKTDLASLTFSNSRSSESDIGGGRLEYLRAALT
ncbi:hypothetical protein BDZ45DRAFT_181631 [Acephala macrosclerotiorum]|nr:hypothetical protein BDZ45DRAFT_181631 [Acephala macrosclerotiorum]